jgi:hypothetical protein
MQTPTRQLPKSRPVTDSVRIVQMDVALKGLVKLELENCRARWGSVFRAALPLSGIGAERLVIARCFVYTSALQHGLDLRRKARDERWRPMRCRSTLTSNCRWDHGFHD